MMDNKTVLVLLALLIAGAALVGSISQNRSRRSQGNIVQNNNSSIKEPKFEEPAMWKYPQWPTADPTQPLINTPDPSLQPTLTSLPSSTPTITLTLTPPIIAGNYSYRNLTNPSRVEVYDRNSRWVATFTNESYTVSLAGPERTFREASSPFPVSHTIWVRLLPNPFSGVVDESWLTRELANRNPDIIDLTFQYIVGAPVVRTAQGQQIAGDANYGPLQSDGTRQEGSDFNDYLGVTWNYPDGTTDPNEQIQIRSLDCSGFMRMVLGYRNNIPLSIDPKSGYMPRRSFQIFALAPGVVTVSNNGSQVTNFSPLNVGDLVFFDGSTNDGTQIDHVGMYIGVDQGGHQRFISSRKSANGPTIGDINGASILDGTGHYARTFRGVRRI